MDTCPNCHLGYLQVRRVTYLWPYGLGFVTFRGVRAWLCDVCGELSYDESALEQLDMLVGVDAELEPGRRPRSRRAPAGTGGEPVAGALA
jgi:YgiT-type zinc finger domain-containing protein